MQELPYVHSDIQIGLLQKVHIIVASYLHMYLYLCITATYQLFKTINEVRRVALTVTNYNTQNTDVITKTIEKTTDLNDFKLKKYYHHFWIWELNLTTIAT